MLFEEDVYWYPWVSVDILFLLYPNQYQCIKHKFQCRETSYISCLGNILRWNSIKYPKSPTEFLVCQGIDLFFFNFDPSRKVKPNYCYGGLFLRLKLDSARG